MIGYSVRPGTDDETVPISPGPIRAPMPAPSPGPAGTTTVDAVRRDPEFRQLRGRLRRFVFTVTPLFLTWYGLFVVLSAFAPSLMRIPVIGSVNLGMLLGLAQFASTLAIVALYGRFARREIDPRVRALRDTHEGGGTQHTRLMRAIRDDVRRAR